MSDTAQDSLTEPLSEPLTTDIIHTLQLHRKLESDASDEQGSRDVSQNPVAPVATNPSASAEPAHSAPPSTLSETSGLQLDPLEDEKLARRVPGVMFRRYDPGKQEEDITQIRGLIAQDLSEPYGIYVYRYFLFTWPELCWMAIDRSTQSLIATIVCKLEHTRWRRLRGYIAMIAVQRDRRKQGLGTILAERAITSLKEAGADEIVLETEEVNTAALRLYRKLGFLRTKHLKRYYLNGNNAFRLVMYLRDSDHGRDSSDEWEEWGDETDTEPQWA